MVTVAGMLIKPLLLILKTSSELESAADGTENYPDWIDGCIDESVTFNTEASADGLRKLSSRIGTLGALIITYEIMVAIAMLVGVIALISVYIDCGRIRTNLGETCKEGVAFLKLYKHLH